MIKRIKDQLIQNRLTRVKQNESVNVFTESVRMNKSIACVLEDKIIHEFPLLHKHNNTQSGVIGGGGLRVTRYGRVYPGSDIVKGDYKCVIRVNNQSFECSQFPSFEENYSYLLNEVVVKNTFTNTTNTTNKVVEYPEEWKC